MENPSLLRHLSSCLGLSAFTGLVQLGQARFALLWLTEDVQDDAPCGCTQPPAALTPHPLLTASPLWL